MATSEIEYTLTRTGVNVFKKPTKAGGVFYYMYLQKTDITEENVKDIVQKMSDSRPEIKLKLGVGKKAYQISFSYDPSQVSSGQILNMLESTDVRLTDLGFVNTYPKAKSSSRTKKTQGTTQPEPVATTEQRPESAWGVGDIFIQSIKGLEGVIGVIRMQYPKVITVNNKDFSENETDVSTVNTLIDSGTWELYQMDKGLVVEMNDGEIYRVQERIGNKVSVKRETTDGNISQYEFGVNELLYLILRYQVKIYREETEPSTTVIPEDKGFIKTDLSSLRFESLVTDILKDKLKDLVFLNSMTSDIDFEKKVNINTQISRVQKEIDAEYAMLFNNSLSENEFFDRVFEQSFTPLMSRYDDRLQKNDSNELVSPSGEISDLNEDVEKLINSESFKEWFGDWRLAFFYRNLPDFGGFNVSKVLSEKFEPLVCWHGTGAEFSYFKFENFPIIYFAANRKYSDFFAQIHSTDGVGYVLPFFLNIKNPLDFTQFGNNEIGTQEFFDFMFLKTGLSEQDLEFNPIMLDPRMPKRPIWVYLRNNPAMLKKISDLGVYDGLKFYEFCPNLEKTDPAYETLAFAIFSPHQAKLAAPFRGDILLASLKSFMLKYGGKI